MNTDQVGTTYDYHREGNFYRRLDSYKGETFWVWVTSRQDRTPTQKHWQHGQHSPDCGWCYLGGAHSQAEHERDAREHRRRSQPREMFALSANPILEPGTHRVSLT